MRRALDEKPHITPYSRVLRRVFFQSLVLLTVFVH